MSREKLKKLGIELPVIPTTSVGSLPKPPALVKARALRRRGALSSRELRRLEDEATVFWVRKQEELGIDVLVDGEQYRGDMVEYFAENMDGFKPGGLVRSYGNRFYRKPIISGKIRWRGPITVERWASAQKLTARPLKGMLTGPYTIMDWCFLEGYPDRRSATTELAGQLRREAAALVKAGAKIVQIDEPAISTRPEEVGWAFDALRAATEGLDAYFVMHCCYGEFHRIYDELRRLPVDNLDLEMSNSNLDLLALLRERPLGRDISVGIVDAHSRAVEDLAIVEGRLRRAVEAVGPERVWADPDCGLKTRTVEEAIGKLRVVQRAALEVRKSLGSSPAVK
ncbi:MAG: methionine synthase [Elusimicrobia bacterium]|nr:methionine synthase [Elusimicrobiota bacterium]